MAKTGTGSKVDAELIRELAQLLDETGLTEIELGREGWHVRIAKTQTITAAAPLAHPQPATPASPPSSGSAEGANADHPGAVLSPMVGIVYAAPEEGAPPFVKVGDAVSEGQTLLLIEAMKVFNPIAAPTSGRIVSILVANGSPVEYGEPLMIIE